MSVPLVIDRAVKEGPGAHVGGGGMTPRFGQISTLSLLFFCELALAKKYMIVVRILIMPAVMAENG